MQVRDRIKELRRVRAADLRPNPRNWRTHPARQRDALRGILAEVGYADALLARELPDGSLELVDGHLRAETTPEALVPVLVLDVDQHEAAKLLAVLDPLASLAGRDDERLADLLAAFDSQNAALEELVRDLAMPSGQLAHPHSPTAPPDNKPRRAEPAAAESSYQVVVECADETEQEALFERLRAEGYRCRVLTL